MISFAFLVSYVAVSTYRIGEFVARIGWSPQRVEDLPAIVHTFSCRPYGLRRFEKALKREFAGGGW